MKRSFAQTLVAAGAVVLAAGCGPLLHKHTGGLIGDPGEVVVNDFDFGKLESNTLDVAEDYFDETNASAFEEETRVFVPTVRLLFNTRQGAAASAQGRTTRAGYSTTVKVKMNLAGVDNKTFQKIADETWADLKTRLEGLGLEVVDPAKYQDSENWKKLTDKDVNKEGIKPFDIYGGEFVFTTPEGMPAYTYPGEEGGLSVFGAFNLSNRADMIEQDIAKELGKVLVVVPTYVIDFAKCYTQGGTFSNTAKAECKPVMILRYNTVMKYVSTEKLDGFMSAQSAAGQVNLTENVETNADFGTVTEIDTDSFELYIPYHSYSGSETGVYAVNADPEKFAAAAQKVIDAGNQMIFAIVKDEIK